MEQAAAVDTFDNLYRHTEQFVRSYQRDRSASQHGEQVSRMIGIIARALLTAEDPYPAIRAALNAQHDAVYPDLDRLASIARSLRLWIGDPRRMRVDFTATAGSTLDPQVQEPWKTSIPDAPVRWVVFPA